MKYLGKKVKVQVPERGNDTKPTGKLITVVGTCELEPTTNSIFGVPFYTVVDRMPVLLNSLNEIELV